MITSEHLMTCDPNMLSMATNLPLSDIAWYRESIHHKIPLMHIAQNVRLFKGLYDMNLFDVDDANLIIDRARLNYVSPEVFELCLGYLTRAEAKDLLSRFKGTTYTPMVEKRIRSLKIRKTR